MLHSPRLLTSSSDATRRFCGTVVKYSGEYHYLNRSEGLTFQASPFKEVSSGDDVSTPRYLADPHNSSFFDINDVALDWHPIPLGWVNMGEGTLYLLRTPNSHNQNQGIRWNKLTSYRPKSTGDLMSVHPYDLPPDVGIGTLRQVPDVLKSGISIKKFLEMFGDLHYTSRRLSKDFCISFVSGGKAVLYHHMLLVGEFNPAGELVLYDEHYCERVTRNKIIEVLDNINTRIAT